MTGQDPSPQTTLLILLGASSWPRADLESSTAFENAVRSLQAYFLSDPDGFHLSTSNVLDLFNSNDPGPVILDQISDFLKERITMKKASGAAIRDVVVCYVGHGGFTIDSSAFFLAIRRTRRDYEKATSVTIDDLAERLRKGARFQRRVLILDCCFAAAALKFLQGSATTVLLREKTIAAFEEKDQGKGFPSKGTSFLASSGKGAASVILPDESSTMFTSAFLSVLRIGDPSQNRKLLPLRTVHRLTIDFLSKTYGENNFPRPELHSPDQTEGMVEDVPFFPNRAMKAVKGSQWEEVPPPEEEKKEDQGVPQPPVKIPWAYDRWEPHNAESRDSEAYSVKQIGRHSYYLIERLRDEASVPGLVRRHYKALEMGRMGESHYTWIKQVALKRELVGREGEREMAPLREEAKLLQELRRQGSGFPAVEELELRPDSVTLVYSCVPGRTLSAAFGQGGKIEGPLGRANTSSLLRSMPELCQQLSRLHQAQHAHRFITPETLILNSSGTNKSVVLRDLGLATEPFRPGEGPAGYAAPEQNHDGYHLPGTDIYQLGGVLYHLLTGKRASSHLDQSQVAPPNWYNRELPHGMDTVLLKALQQEVQQRWSTIQEFATALQQAMSSFR